MADLLVALPLVEEHQFRNPQILQQPENRQHCIKEGHGLQRDVSKTLSFNRNDFRIMLLIRSIKGGLFS